MHNWDNLGKMHIMQKIRDSHRDAKEYSLLHKKYAMSNSNFVCSTATKYKALSEYNQRGFSSCAEKSCTKNAGPQLKQFISWLL